MTVMMNALKAKAKPARPMSKAKRRALEAEREAELADLREQLAAARAKSAEWRDAWLEATKALSAALAPGLTAEEREAAADAVLRGAP